ncbi:hypothetical protein SLA2020_523610 [Shorea laevis]
MASGDAWDFQKAFDLYLYDYLVKKNRRKTAAIFKAEANVDKPVLIDTPMGFLHEWWSIFYDVYVSRQPMQQEANAEEASIKAVRMTENPLQSVHPIDPQLMRNQPRSGQVPVNFDLKMMLEQPAACLLAAKQYEEKQLRQAPRNFDPSSQLIETNKLTVSKSVPANSSHLQREICNVDQGHGVRDCSYGISLERNRLLDPTLFGSQRSMLPLTGPIAAEINEGINQVTLTGCTLQPSNYQQQLQISTTKHQSASSAQGMSSMLGNMAYVFSGSSAEFNHHSSNLPEGDLSRRNTQKAVPVTQTAKRQYQLDEAQHHEDGKRKKKLETLRIEDKTKDCAQAEENRTVDENVDSFLSHEHEHVNSTSTPFTNLIRHSRSGNKNEHKGFSFEEVGCLHSSKSKILCCHFSSDGKLLASAGHEKKVFVWDMENFCSFRSSEGHGLLITDVRFKPYSTIFATSSFDKTVKIWDAARPNKSLFQLLGHAEQVMSLDFHPRKTDLLCSCDGNDEIRLWNVNQCSCLHVSKGATKQVRFQPQLGKLIATATGKGVNVIDVETNSLQFCFKGHSKEVLSVCWDSNGKYIASISEDSAQMWSVSDRKCLHKLQSNGNKFQSCIFHPGYSQLLVIGGYQSLELWNPIESNKTWAVEAHNGLISALADSVNTEMIASASHDQCVKVWK